MLTETQYKELLRYCNYDLPFDGQSNETLNFLFRKKYIVKHRISLPDGQISEDVICSITEPGRKALEEFEEHADVMADKSAEKKSDRRFQILNSLLSAVVGSLLTLFVEHFSEIIQFIGNLFH